MSENAVPANRFEGWDAELRAALAGIYLDEADAAALRVMRAAPQPPDGVPICANPMSSGW